jgi:hypothetical protein
MLETITIKTPACLYIARLFVPHLTIERNCKHRCGNLDLVFVQLWLS